ncbi:MAG: photosystem I biogenesis protein BtpA [Microcoleaceae cyanobacterium]
MDLQHIFKTDHPIIGVVHLLPLPTSPRWEGDLHEVMDRAEQEATALASGGVHGIIVENFFDTPFAKQQVDPAVVSAMTLVVQRLMNLITLPVGVNVLRNDAQSALAIAACTGAQFIRVNVLNGVTATDQGLIEGNAHQLLRYRRELGCDVKILADVLVKHGRSLSSSHVTTAVAETVERALADAVILSGWATGYPPSREELELARTTAKHAPVLIGSGADLDNVANLMPAADGVIVSSSLKRHGRIHQPVDPNRVRQFVDAVYRSLEPPQLAEEKPTAELEQQPPLPLKNSG